MNDDKRSCSDVFYLSLSGTRKCAEVTIIMYGLFELHVWKSLKRKHFFTINFVRQCEIIIDFTEKAERKKKPKITRKITLLGTNFRVVNNPHKACRNAVKKLCDKTSSSSSEWHKQQQQQQQQNSSCHRDRIVKIFVRNRN